MIEGRLGLISGGHIDLLDPHPDQFTDDDIALGLARESRYGGQVLDDKALMYSVCQHSVYGCWRAMEVTGNDVIAGLVLLLHDASEGLGMKDIPSPLKMVLPEYKAIEAKVMDAVWQKYGIHFPDYEDFMHRIDKEILHMELHTFRGHGDGPGLDHFDAHYIWSTNESAAAFTLMLNVLLNQRDRNAA
jgi:hypothetical protein